MPQGDKQKQIKTWTQSNSMGGQLNRTCLFQSSRNPLCAMALIISMRNDNETWHVAGCVFWFWFKPALHEYTKSCKTAIKEKAANHTPGLCWIICIDTVWGCHACCSWKEEAPISFQQIAMNVLVYVTVTEIRKKKPPTEAQSFSEWHNDLTKPGNSLVILDMQTGLSSLFSQSRWSSV